MASGGFGFGASNPAGTATGTSGGGFSFGGANTGASGSTGFSFGGTGTSGTTGSTGFSFGQTSTGGAAPATGFNFGGTSTGTTGSTGFNFGGPSIKGTSSTSSGFGFGATSTPGTSTGTTGFSFGGAVAGGTSTGQSAFGTFGTTPANAGQTFGTFGTTPANAGQTFGTTPFGTTPASTGQAFGATPFGTTPASSGQAFGATPFGTTPVSAAQGFAFGAATSQANKQAFGFGTGTPTGTAGTGFLGSTGFGTKPIAGFGAQLTDASQQQNAGQPDPSLALHLAICAPSYFNNENDEVLRKWNQLQAFWGAGKGFYAQNMPPVEFTPENPYCRFKTVCYAKIPNFKNEDGIVQVVMGKSLSDVEPHKNQIVSTLSSSVFSGAEVVVEDVYASELPDKTNLRMYVQQHAGSGEKQRAPATEVCRHMGLPTHAQTLKNLCIQDVLPLQAMSEAQKKEYLDTPQRGIDPSLWEQGKRENPDPKNFVPVVRIGFQELQKQFKYQEEFAKNLHSNMEDILDEIKKLKNRQTIVKAAIQNAKWKQTNLTRKILKLVSAQEVERKQGVPLDQTEEQIRMRLEDLYLQLMQPTQFRGCLNELMAQMSVKPGNSRGNPRYGLIGGKERDVTQYISKQHDALQAVVSVLKDDMRVVDNIMEEMHRKS